MKAEDDDPAKRPRFKKGNTASDGNYIVGKGRPPKHTRFAKGDGRKRGRRPKGLKNFDTVFREESERKITISEGGKKRKVSKLASVVARALDNAGAKGQNQAISIVLGHAQRIADRQRSPENGLERDEIAMLDAWLEQELAKRKEGDNPGDPEKPLAAPPDDAAEDNEEPGNE